MRNGQTRLLVSVRSRREAEDALEGGADLIDIKEPTRGPLGMADLGVWREVAEAIAGRAPLSVALGELRGDKQPCLSPEADSEAADKQGCLWLRGDKQPCLSSIQFAKLGLAGCAALDDWSARWSKALEAFPSHVQRVAVSYADWRAAEAPPPRDVIEAGIRLGCRAWLIDTCGKRAGGLLDQIGLQELAELIALARRGGMLTVVAGSLTRESIPQVTPLSPDYVAVRGAVCRGGREGTLDPHLVRASKSMLPLR